MKLFTKWWLLGMACGWSVTANAQLQLATNVEPARIFSGEARKNPVIFHNPGTQNFNGEIRSRIFQASSATAVLLSENPWKRIEIPADETVMDSAALNFPAVKAKTKFLVQWLADSNRVLGVTTVLIYPTNLLQTLQPLLCETNFGVLDPDNQLKPLLKAQGVQFADLEKMELNDFAGQLAVIGPFESKAQMPDELAMRIRTIAKRNVAVVWIQPPSEQPEKILPSFYCVQMRQTAVVVVQPDLVSDLAENPQSQLNLIYFCRLAMNPRPPVLPDLPPP